MPARRWTSTPLLLLGVFLGFNLLGGILLASPMAAADGVGAGFRIAFFTAVSASTVTGLTAVDTVGFWSHAGEAVIFAPMLLGGLEFITAATALVNVIGRRATRVEEDVYRDTMVTMLVGRIGPLTLVMMLTPRDTASYRYPRERIGIG